MPDIFETLETADSVEVDDHLFVRYFNVASVDEDIEGDVFLTIEATDDDGNDRNWSFTREELAKADHKSIGNSWLMPNGTTLKFYRVVEC